MKKLSTILLAVVCLCSACQTRDFSSSKGGDSGRVKGAEVDSAALYQEMAYREMFADSLQQAEQHAYRAFLLSRDSTLECGALSLLCYIYYREGKQQDLQLLLQTISPEAYMDIMDVQLQVEQAKAGEERRFFSVVIVLLLLTLGSLGLWYLHRMRSLRRMYQQRISAVKESSHDIGEAKAGIDVLFAIINDQNISQMGKQEEQAVLKTLPIIDTHLAALLDKAASPLTPKETFFCIMEYYGKNDHQKARSFCCSEQAVRSTKSRLGKKFDISALRSE